MHFTPMIASSSLRCNVGGTNGPKSYGGSDAPGGLDGRRGSGDLDSLDSHGGTESYGDLDSPGGSRDCGLGGHKEALLKVLLR